MLESRLAPPSEAPPSQGRNGCWHSWVQPPVPGDPLGLGANTGQFMDQLVRASGGKLAPHLFRRRVIMRQDLPDQLFTDGSQDDAIGPAGPRPVAALHLPTRLVAVHQARHIRA